MGKTIHGDARTIVLKVLTFFENEKANKRFLIPVDQAVKRACAATGISKSTILKIKNEAKIALSQTLSPTPSTTASGSDAKPIIKLATPGKKRKPSSKKIKLDSLDLRALENIVQSFYTVRKEIPTLKKILAAAKNEINFPGGLTTLGKILRNQLGYKCKNTRTVLIQKPEIAAGSSKSDDSENEYSDSDSDSDTMSGIEELQFIDTDKL